MAKKKSFIEYKENSAEIERRKKESEERKQMMKKALDTSSAEDIRSDMSSLPMDISQTAIRQVKNAGRVMMGRFNKILSDIDLVPDPATRAKLQMELTRLYVNDIPKRIFTSVSTTDISDGDVSDVLFEPLDDSKK